MFNKSMEDIIQAIRESLASVVHPRFYATERGYQGEFGAELRGRIRELGIGELIVEPEYQKTLKEHGLKIRPDLVVHVPFQDDLFDSRSEGNYVAIELKLRANQKKAMEDYENLSAICEKLNYPLGVFININSEETFIEDFDGNYKDRILAFAVRLVDGGVEIVERNGT